METPSRLGNTLSVLIFLIAFLPVYAFFAITIIISRIFRCVVGIAISLQSGKKTEFLNGSDCLFLVAHGKSKLQEAGTLSFQGKFDLDWIRDQFSKTLRSDRRSYSHFYKFPKKCFGYFYWQEDDNFDINDHISLYDCKPPSNYQQLAQLYTDMVNSKLERAGKSPWKLFVFPLADDFPNLPTPGPHYVWLMLAHHVLSDGLGMFLTCGEVLQKSKPIQVPSKTSIISSVVSKCTEYLIVFVNAPMFLFKQLSVRDKNILHRIPQIGDRIVAISPPIPLERVKTIKSATGTTVNDVMTSCVVAAIEKHFQRENEALPGDIHCMIPVSMRKPEHPILSNALSAITFKLPLNCATPLERLAATTKQIKSLKTSTEHLCLYHLQNCIVNQLPSFFTSLLGRNVHVTFLLTNLINPVCSPCKEEAGNVVSAGGCPPHGGNIGFAIIIMSSNGLIQLTISSDKTVFSKSETLERILQDCVGEVDLLEQKILSNKKCA